MTLTNQRLTLKDVAKLHGVSAATISNVYKRPDQLSAVLRNRILKECETLGYYGPRAAARSLRAGKTNIVGVMLSNNLAYSFSDPIANQFLQGLAKAFEAHNYNLLVIPSREHIKQVQGLESFVDGFIVYGAPESNKLEQLVQQKKSLVAVDFEIEGYPSINIDNYTSAKECAAYALRNKATRVAILALRIIDSSQICQPENGNLFNERDTITIPRLHGFLDAAKEKNIAIPSEWITHIPDNTYDYSYTAAHDALTRTPRPQLLLCMSDRIALAAIQAAHDLGLKIPDDIRITGFDDIPESANQHPSLTTIRQFSTRKGEIAAEMFLGLAKPAQIILPTELVIRESCP